MNGEPAAAIRDELCEGLTEGDASGSRALENRVSLVSRTTTNLMVEFLHGSIFKPPGKNVNRRLDGCLAGDGK